MTEAVKVTGVVEAVKRDSRGFKIKDDGWYNAYNASMLNGASRGQEVEFEYVQKGPFKNIKGDVKIVGGSTTPTSDSGGSQKTSSYVQKEFPVPPLHPDRSIIRQNALRHATELLVAGALEPNTTFDNDAELINYVIDTARSFEAYASGELDLQAAKDKMDS